MNRRELSEICLNCGSTDQVFQGLLGTRAHYRCGGCHLWSSCATTVWNPSDRLGEEVGEGAEGENESPIRLSVRD